MNPDSMTFDRLDAESEGRQAASQASFTRATALGLFLLVAQHSAHAQLTAEPLLLQVPGLHQQAAQSAVLIDVREIDIIRALVEFHDRLLATQEELSVEARDVLHKNLWNLYE
jgi:hypothetical protein